MFHIDPEKLTTAVKARPFLYNKNDEMCYTNKTPHQVKEMLRLEVTEEVLENTDPLLNDKLSFVPEVQKRWRSLRSCFARELTTQRKEDIRRVDGKGCIKKRKRYEYFDNLLFLKGEAKGDGKDNSFNEVSEHCTNEHVYLCDGYGGEGMADVKSEGPDEADYEIKDTKGIYENSDSVKIHTCKKYKIEEPDEDAQLALSLVHSLRKLDTRSNLEAKIQILKAIQAVTYKCE